MILIIPTGNDKEDTALLLDAGKLQRKYFSKHNRDKLGLSGFEPKRGVLCIANDRQVSLSQLVSGEKLYIVGHTDIVDGRMWLSEKTAEELADCLISHGLNVHQYGLKLILIGCRSGKTYQTKTGSFAWQLWCSLMSRLNSLDFHNRSMELCSLLVIKAPKVPIAFDRFGEAIVIPENYDAEYLLMSQTATETQRAQWIASRQREAEASDYQWVGGLFRPMSRYRVHCESGDERVICKEDLKSNSPALRL